MRIAVFSTQPYDEAYLQQAKESSKHQLVFFEQTLSASTVALAAGFPTVCVFVNDRLDASLLAEISRTGTKLIALRAAGASLLSLRRRRIHRRAAVGTRPQDLPRMGARTRRQLYPGRAGRARPAWKGCWRDWDGPHWLTRC